jgi:hypothetical protein
MRKVSNLRRLQKAAAIFCLSLVVFGCSKEGAKPNVMASNVFDSAPKEVKDNWLAAGKHAAKGDFMGAVSNFTLVFKESQSLTPEQQDALLQAWLDAGNQAFKAANNGDKEALEAVRQIRESPYGRVPGQR